MEKQIKPAILVISLGGTILSVSADPADQFYSAPSLDINQILTKIPNLSRIANVQTETLFNIISHEMTTEMLITLGRRIQALVDNPDVAGIVVAQGTNALEEVAYFINLIVQTEKPIVFTGAMKPTNELGFDGVRNLYNAIALAASPEAHNRGVLITFSDNIVSARNAAKLSDTLGINFAINNLVSGHIHADRPYFCSTPCKRYTSRSEFKINEISEFPSVYILYGYLGSDPSVVEAMTNLGARGIISVGMGGGYQPLPVTLALARASESGIIVVRCTTMSQGIVHWDENTDGKYGFVPGDSLTPQKARILLAIALSKTSDKNEIKRIFSEY